MENQLGATGTGAQTSMPFGSPVEPRIHAPQAGHGIAEKSAMQIRKSHERLSAATAGDAGPLKASLSAAAFEFTRTTPSPYAACPSCGYDMIVTSVTPTFLREGCEYINYTCKRCGTQMQRMVKSS